MSEPVKHAVFFCENCGKPVPLDAERCPHCKSTFTAVQCPQCSFIGEARFFAAGCPQCGYLSTTGEHSRTPEHITTTSPENEQPTESSQASSRKPTSQQRKYRKSASRLPGWFYTVASLLLLVLLVVLALVALHLR